MEKDMMLQPANMRVERIMEIMNMEIHIISVFTEKVTLRDAMEKIVSRQLNELPKDYAWNKSAALDERNDSG